MRKNLIISLTALFMTMNYNAQTKGIDLTINFFNAVKKNSEDKEVLKKEIAVLNPEELEKELDSDLKTLAFWINIYNANIQYLLKQDTMQYSDRGSFFKKQQIKSFHYIVNPIWNKSARSSSVTK